MSIMSSVHLRSIDQNLLHALHALLEERHVTRAAKRCFLTLNSKTSDGDPQFPVPNGLASEAYG
jgi:hypothetical protein